MKTYQLKPGIPAFEVVDGPLAGRRYVPGRQYPEADVPGGDRAKFKEVKPKASAKAKTKDKGGDV